MASENVVAGASGNTLKSYATEPPGDTEAVVLAALILKPEIELLEVLLAMV